MPDDTKSPLAEALVASVETLRAAELPAQTIDAVRRSTLQILGIAPLGALSDIAAQGIGYIVEAEPGSAATVVDHGRASSAAGAAFANALASHADFREDTHAESQSHPAVVVIPAVLAAAETLGALPDGRYVAAVVAGHEIIGRLGESASVLSTARGFRPPSVYTLFGATVAVSMALGLDRATTVDAIAIAAQGASGLNHPFTAGTEEWFLAPALAARQAVMSAFLARAGIKGSPRALEGEDGVLAAFAGDAALVVDTSAPGRGRPFEIEHTRLKAQLTCGWNQSLVHQLSQVDVDVDRLQAIRVRMSPGAATYPGVGEGGPYETRSQALLSSGFAAALQLVRGGLGQSGYRDLAAPELLRVAELVSVTPDPSLEGYATAVEIDVEGEQTVHLADGNDNPGFSLGTVEQVVQTLRRNYETDGLDPARVDRIADGVTALVDRDDPSAVAAALGAA